MNNLELLKSLLSVPSHYREEGQMVKFITNWLNENHIPFYVDRLFNIYATKTSDGYEDKPYPCVVAHTDTVHKIQPIFVNEEMLFDADETRKFALKGYTDETLTTPSGIGGDDKCGIFGCMQMLLNEPHVKAAFFVTEEIGCIGSREADPTFFEDVAYAIQFDGPENWMITEVCSGVRLFNRESEFFEVLDRVLEKNFSYYQYMIHPYTDVSQLKMKFDFACVNIAAGYYDYHTPQEYVIVEDLQRSIHTASELIKELGYRKHEYVYKKPNYSFPY